MPAFTHAGSLQAVSIDAFVDVVRPHARDSLELIVFTGCKTDALAKALQERTCVSCCVCWSSKLHDEAGRIFGAAFAASTAEGRTPEEAFEAACTKVKTATEPDFLDGGQINSLVQKFELISPDDSALVYRAATAVPEAHRGRLKSHAPGTRGRLAAGVPVLLKWQPKLAFVPPLADKLVEKPDEIIGVLQMLETTADTYSAGLHGMGGVGKSTLAACLAHDVRVHAICPNGVVWVDFGQEKSAESAMQDLTRRVASLLKQPIPETDSEGQSLEGLDPSEKVRKQLQLLFNGRRVLVIADDVWEASQALPLRDIVKLSGLSLIHI